MYVLDHNLPIDTSYYLSNQLREVTPPINHHFQNTRGQVALLPRPCPDCQAGCRLQPMLRLFVPIIGKAKAMSLFTGSHTLVVKKSQPSKSVGGLMSFVERSEPCLGAGCKSAVKKAAAKVCLAFCSECR